MALLSVRRENSQLVRSNRPIRSPEADPTLRMNADRKDGEVKRPPTQNWRETDVLAAGEREKRGEP
jgi:hypothetical protein